MEEKFSINMGGRRPFRPEGDAMEEIKELLQQAFPGAIIVEGDEHGPTEMPGYWQPCVASTEKSWMCTTHGCHFRPEGQPLDPDDDTCTYREVVNQAAYFANRPGGHSASHVISAVALYLALEITPHESAGEH